MRNAGLLRALALGLASAAITPAQITFTNPFGTLTFNLPIWFGELPGKPGTFVVAEQHTGNLMIVTGSGSAWSKASAVKLSVADGPETGLLGVAFHPDFAHNRKYYLSYIPRNSLESIIEERMMNATLVKDDSTYAKRTIMKLTQPADNHNGGNIAFGPKDGFLYIGWGDGGNQEDPRRVGQNKNSLFGKMLRIDVDKKDGNLEYASPSDNPFASGGGAKEIFAYGFRNPWRWSFDAVTGDLWVGDVGQDVYEEEDLVVKGGNYGWSVFEADGCQNGPCTDKTGFTFPVYSYSHSNGNAIIGGYVYRGDPGSSWYGKLFVADHGTRKLWALTPSGQNKATVQALNNVTGDPSSFGVDAKGGLYVLNLGGGQVLRMLPASSANYVPARGPLRSEAERTFAARPGAPLDPALFRDAAEAQVFSLDGALAARLERARSRLPESLTAGVYLVRASGAARPDLLVVR